MRVWWVLNAKHAAAIIVSCKPDVGAKVMLFNSSILISISDSNLDASRMLCCSITTIPTYLYHTSIGTRIRSAIDQTTWHVWILLETFKNRGEVESFRFRILCSNGSSRAVLLNFQMANNQSQFAYFRWFRHRTMSRNPLDARGTRTIFLVFIYVLQCNIMMDS